MKKVTWLVIAVVWATFGALALASTLPPPSITFDIADGSMIHQSAGLVKFGMTAADGAGLSTTSLSAGYSSVSSRYDSAPKSAFVALYFYASYYPVGDYVIKGTAKATDGGQASKMITVHLVP